jgi:hypothetical protein
MLGRSCRKGKPFAVGQTLELDVDQLSAFGLSESRPIGRFGPEAQRRCQADRFDHEWRGS